MIKYKCSQCGQKDSRGFMGGKVYCQKCYQAEKFEAKRFTTIECSDCKTMFKDLKFFSLCKECRARVYYIKLGDRN